jgi:hypothetical protein
VLVYLTGTKQAVYCLFIWVGFRGTEKHTKKSKLCIFVHDKLLGKSPRVNYV